MNRRILASLLVIGVVGTVAAGSTMALFNDTETSSGNTFTAGALDLKVDWNESYNGEHIETQPLTDNPGPIFNFNDVKPGDHGEATVSLHLFNNPGFVNMNISQVVNRENGCTEPESLVDDSCDDPGFGQGELDEEMRFTVWQDDGDNVLEQGENVLYSNVTAEELADENVKLDADPSTEEREPFGNSTTFYVGIKWNIPKSVGNEIQTDSAEFDFDFSAVQARHNGGGDFNNPGEEDEDSSKKPGNDTDEEDEENCHYHGEGEDRTQHCVGEDNPHEDEESEKPGNETEEDQDLGDIPGCQEGEVHIPEDTDCDGDIEDRFKGNDTDDDSDERPENETDEDDNDSDDVVVEEPSTTPAPEPSAKGEDWISYPNPRDHYLHPETHRPGSIKVCKILLNQNGEVITGSTIPDTEFSVETSIGDVVPDYADDASPVTFETELNQVADVVGTSPDLIEGDGQLDAECAEFHDLPLNQTYTYGQETISGENADKVETVGYQEYWERVQPPYKQGEPYGSSNLSDGEVRLTPGDNNRHAEIYIVNQLKG